MNASSFIRTDNGTELYNLAYIKKIYMTAADVEENGKTEKAFCIKALTADNEEILIAAYNNFTAAKGSFETYSMNVDAL